MAEGGSEQMSDKERANEYKAQGNKFLSEEKYLDAIEQYTRGISIDPENHVLYSNRSAAHAKMDNYAEALSDAEQVVRLRPDWVKGYSRKGSALQFLGRYEEAIEVFKKGLQFDKDNETMKKGIKECQDEMDGPSASQPLGNPFANLETIMPRLMEDERTKHYAKDPTYMAMLNDLGTDPMKMQKYLKDDRLRLTLSALLGFDLEKPEEMNFDEPPFTDDPDLVDVNKEPTKTLELPDEPKIAEMKLVDKEKSVKEKQLGSKYLEKNDFVNAHEHYDIALQYDPSNIAVYSNKALAYQRQKQPLKVREMSLKVIEIGKTSSGNEKVIAKAYMRIGQTYMDEGKYDIALENLQLSMRENQNPEAAKKIKFCRENIGRQAGS